VFYNFYTLEITVLFTHYGTLSAFVDYYVVCLRAIPSRENETSFQLSFQLLCGNDPALVQVIFCVNDCVY